MKKIIIVLCLLLAGNVSVLHAQQKIKKRPNIIYMMSDDHGYQAISADGFGLNSTPNIDKLA